MTTDEAVVALNKIKTRSPDELERQAIGVLLQVVPDEVLDAYVDVLGRYCEALS